MSIRFLTFLFSMVLASDRRAWMLGSLSRFSTQLSVMRRRLLPYRWIAIGTIGLIGGIGGMLLVARASAPWATQIRTAIDEKIRVIKILRDPTVALLTSENRT